MAPKPPEIDPSVGWAIQEAVNQAEKRFGDLLDKKLEAMREEYRTCTTCAAIHEKEAAERAALGDRIKSLERWLFWAATFSIGSLAGLVITLALLLR